MPIGLVLDLARNALTVAIMLAGPLLGVASPGRDSWSAFSRP
jgi:hypothetical protein